MSYVLAYVQGITADEEVDDIFCEKMLEDYKNDPDSEKDKTYTLEKCIKLSFSPHYYRMITHIYYCLFRAY